MPQVQFGFSPPFALQEQAQQGKATKAREDRYKGLQLGGSAG